MTELFQDYIKEKKLINIRNIISIEYIPDSTLNSLFDVIKNTEKCGIVRSNDLLAYKFDALQNNEEVTVVIRDLKRDSSEEEYIFYVSNKENKIVFITINSINDCKN